MDDTTSSISDTSLQPIYSDTSLHDNDTSLHGSDTASVVYDLNDTSNDEETKAFIPPVKTIINKKQTLPKKLNITRKVEGRQQLQPQPSHQLEPPHQLDPPHQLKQLTKKEEKSKLLEELFVPDLETIEYFTKGLYATKVLTKKSGIQNDTILLCLLFKSNKLQIKDYKCSKSACKIKNTWNDKQIQLLIKRKNGVSSDLTPSNLELVCPNCYIQDVGLDLFKKLIARTEFLCKYCKFPLVNFSNSKKKGGICLACEKRLVTISAEKDDIDYDNQLKSLYKDNPYLNDDLKKSKYYSEVSRYKNFVGNSQKPKAGNLSSIKPSEKSIVIACNMDIGDIDELTDMIQVEATE